LHKRTREEDLRDAFSKFGKLKEVSLKFNYAIKEMDGKTFVNGEELVVE
jgi:RNA recognition motif-containing protein